MSPTIRADEGVYLRRLGRAFVLMVASVRTILAICAWLAVSHAHPAIHFDFLLVNFNLSFSLI